GGGCQRRRHVRHYSRLRQGVLDLQVEIRQQRQFSRLSAFARKRCCLHLCVGRAAVRREPARRMTDDPETKLSSTIVAEALEWVGTPYRHQASLKGVACDCLGLVRGVWRSIYGLEPEDAG